MERGRAGEIMRNATKLLGVKRVKSCGVSASEQMGRREGYSFEQIASPAETVSNRVLIQAVEHQRWRTGRTE